MHYTVGAAAKLLGVAPSTLRYYDREGLLPFVERSNGGVRMFSEKDLGWLRIIACLKCAGMPIRDIHRYMEMAMQGEETIGERLELFEQQRQRLLEQMRTLQQTLDVVEYKCWYYRTAKEAGDESAARDLPPEQMPERFRVVRERLRAEKG